MTVKWLTEEAHNNFVAESLRSPAHVCDNTVLRMIAEVAASRGGAITALDLCAPLGVKGYQAKSLTATIPFEPNVCVVAETATHHVCLTRERRKPGAALVKRVDLAKARAA
jgi:hypothetical protein